MDFAAMMALEPHGPDVWVGTGPSYPWGGLYGGQIVAQALRAATFTVEPEFPVHSLHAYFIRLGDAREPIRFEVDRVRNGRSFCTRRVTARQSVGVILEMTASYQVDEDAPTAQTALMPEAPVPDMLVEDSWSPAFRRCPVRRGAGEVQSWLRIADDIGDEPGLHACGLAYLSDDLPTEAVVSLDRARIAEASQAGQGEDEGLTEADIDSEFFSASLDHAMYFHRPMAADRWHLQAFTCHGLMSSRGVSVGYVFAEDGTHVATVVQEVLLRDARPRRR